MKHTTLRFSVQGDDHADLTRKAQERIEAYAPGLAWDVEMDVDAIETRSMSGETASVGYEASVTAVLG